MERNYIVVKFLDKFYIQYELFSNLHRRWELKIFKDYNNINLYFYNQEDADNWITARIEIL